MNLPYILSISFLIFGFGFVIFWHELGHFLAAKRSGIRVEQFAVGMGQAIFSWRKGIGFCVGNTQKEYERRVTEAAEKKYLSELQLREKVELTPQQRDAAARELGLGDTEYRLNWVPIGGYVKMLGQDDMNPQATSDDPRSYNRKSVGARMFVVSAGVIMNVILAAIGFMILFLVGFNVSPSVVGHVVPGSPAQQANFHVDDQIISIDGTNVEHNFTKVILNSALLRDGDEVIVKVRRDGQPLDLRVTPRRPAPKQLSAMGIGEPRVLAAPEKLEISDAERPLLPRDSLLLNAGDVITAVNGQEVPTPDQYKILNAALQKSFGEPVKIAIKPAGSGAARTADVHPRFDDPFGNEQLNFAGMVPRATVASVIPESPARSLLLPGDTVLCVSREGSNDKYANLSPRQLKEHLEAAGANNQNVAFTVLRDGKEVVVAGLTPNIKLDKAANRRGLGIGLGVDVDHVVVAQVLPDSAADVAKIPIGAEILSLAGKPVKSWNDVFRILSSAKAAEPIDIAFKTPNSDQTNVKLTLSAAQLEEVASIQYTHDLALAPRIVPQKTSNPLVAAKWGMLETRDFILQFYVTLRRFADGTVSPSNAMGPVGIISAGTTVASRGNDWMLWFLCMISANLAVVNFLPIPIVDGGLFMFLILEKIKGKPLSPKAQSIAQVVGLVLLIGVFLFVTYNDITRLL